MDLAFISNQRYTRPSSSIFPQERLVVHYQKDEEKKEEDKKKKKKKTKEERSQTRSISYVKRKEKEKSTKK